MSTLTQWISSTEAQPWQQQTEPSSQARSGEVHLEVTKQTGVTWRGFGGTFNELGWESLQHLSSEERAQALDRLFARDGEMLFDFCRLPIGANDYAVDWYSHAEKPGDLDLHSFSIERDQQRLIPYIKEALVRHPDLELFASPWSPPAWMKNPPVYNYGRFSDDPLVRECYAQYFLRFTEAYQQEGIDIAQVHLQNETNADQKFPSCVMDGVTMADLIGRYLGPAFERAGSSTEVWLGTYNGPTIDFGGHEQTTGFNDYVFSVLQDSDAARYICGLGYQWYAKTVLQRTRQAWPDLPIIQTENECGHGDNKWLYAGYVFDLLWQYLTNDVQAYVYWNMFLEPEGRSTWGWKQNSLFTVDPSKRQLTTNPEYHVMRHFSQFIRPGMQRRVCQRVWSANAVSFASNDSITVVLRNPLQHATTINLALADQQWSLPLAADSFHSLTIEA